MFSGVLALQPNYEIFLRSFFAKKRPPASLTRLLRNQLCPQALGIFLFVSHNWWLRSNWRCLAVKTNCSRIACDSIFIFVPLVSKRKSVLTVWVALLQRFCKAQTDTPLSFDTKGAKESSQRKRRLDISLVATSDKACAALTRAHWRGGSYGLRANILLNINLSCFGEFKSVV